MSKIPVTVLGATGIVGQTIIARLIDHPWFQVTSLCASQRSAGKTYGELIADRWRQPEDLPGEIASIVVTDCTPAGEPGIAISALPSAQARTAERTFAEAGFHVVSNASAYRMAKDVPLIIPEINADHLSLVEDQPWSGSIITNPNCSTVGLCLALAPLFNDFGLKAVHVTTLQAISGAGYPGLSALDLVDNLLPLINGEEDKLETEPQKILGTQGTATNFAVSAQCNRVPVIHGHTLSISVSLEKGASMVDIERSFESYRAPHMADLPGYVEQPLVVHEQPNRPQPLLDRDRANGMQVSIGRVKEDAILDFRFVALVHNLVRGAAGAALLNAELFAREYIRV